MAVCTSSLARIAALAACLSLIAVVEPLKATAAGSEDPVILFATGIATGTPIRVGAYSPFVTFQAKLQQHLITCKKTAAAAALKREAVGQFGPLTTRAIMAITSCPGFEPLASSAAAVKGAVTPGVWRAVMGEDTLPSLAARVDAIVLSFEATDFGEKPEWNFCQDSINPEAIARPDWRGAPQCVNHSDPCSLLTWGPRGATAGQGREIQWVLANVLQRQPDMIENAFAEEFENVKRFVHMQSPPPDRCDGSSALEHFMCAVWTTPARRQRWNEGLMRLGQLPLVRQVFQDVYARDEFDGYKIKAYYRLWNALGLTPSEIDYAFFSDLATHIGEPPEPFPQREMDQCLREQTGARTPNAAARRCLARVHPHAQQPADRLARDITFYIEDYPAESLSAAELRVWEAHIPLKAGLNFGLSDAAPFPIERAIPASLPDVIEPDGSDTSLTAVEEACPLAIRQPNQAPTSIR